MSEADAGRQRQLLEWCAQISTECESRLRKELTEEAEARDNWRRAEQFSKRLLESNWDSSKHPRGGYPENRGRRPAGKAAAALAMRAAAN
ncbi:MAG: hypothetical protein EXS05_18060 [Planctomycetaceae bacterium]|nr:hypothetical protein [Planctomycetaceae bacterium]